MTEQFHHPWCNFPNKPRNGCKMCDMFYKIYPSKGENSQELKDKYFPDNDCINPKNKENKVQP